LETNFDAKVGDDEGSDADSENEEIVNRLAILEARPREPSSLPDN